MDPTERDLIIRTVLAEARDQGDNGMAAVAHVIRNRAGSGHYQAHPGLVVLAKNQFEPWNDSGEAGAKNDPLRFDASSPEYRRAAAIVDGVFGGQIGDPTHGATMFYAPVAQSQLGRNAPSWAKPSHHTATIGGHMFFTDSTGGGGNRYNALTGIAGGSDPTATGAPNSAGGGASAMVPQGMNPTASTGAPAPSTSAMGGDSAGVGAGAPMGQDYQSLMKAFMQPQQRQPGLLGQLLFGNGGLGGFLHQAMPNGLIGGAANGLKSFMQPSPGQAPSGGPSAPPSGGALAMAQQPPQSMQPPPQAGANAATLTPEQYQQERAMFQQNMQPQSAQAPPQPGMAMSQPPGGQGGQMAQLPQGLQALLGMFGMGG